MGDTIDRLDELHRLLSGKRNGLRVQCAAELVPLLVRCYFEVMIAEAGSEVCDGDASSNRLLLTAVFVIFSA